jgi:hypothetical protein
MFGLPQQPYALIVGSLQEGGYPHSARQPASRSGYTLHQEPAVSSDSSGIHRGLGRAIATTSAAFLPTAFPTHSDTFNFNIVDADSIAIVATTPGESGAGTLTKQEIEECSAGTFRGIYIFNQNGLGTFQNPPQLVDAFFPVSVVGTWTFDGKGAVTRSLSLVFGGLPNPYFDVGSYQVNSDCTVSAYFPSDDEPFKLIAIDARRLI